MALQATVILLGLTGLAAMAAVLCALVVMWWALGTCGARPPPSKELKFDPFDKCASTPLPGAQRHAEAGSIDLDLGIDFEAFQAQIGHRCDLELDALCDSAMDDQIARVLQDLEDEFGDASASAAPPPPSSAGGPVGAQVRRQFASAEPLVDFKELQAYVELQCDRALELIDGQCAAELKTLEDAFGGAAQAGHGGPGHGGALHEQRWHPRHSHRRVR